MEKQNAKTYKIRLTVTCKHLPQTEVAIRVSDAKLVALLVKGYSCDLSKGARRPRRANGQLVIKLPENYAAVLTAR